MPQVPFFGRKRRKKERLSTQVAVPRTEANTLAFKDLGDAPRRRDKSAPLVTSSWSLPLTQATMRRQLFVQSSWDTLSHTRGPSPNLNQRSLQTEACPPPLGPRTPVRQECHPRAIGLAVASAGLLSLAFSSLLVFPETTGLPTRPFAS